MMSLPLAFRIAALFHDVGKWREADHAQESLRLAQGMLDDGVPNRARQRHGRRL